MKECIIMCGGDGKTTLFNNYPERFLDIDHFIWGDKNNAEKLHKYISDSNIEAIGNLYKYEMENNIELRNESRVILCHRPENALWLNRNIIGIYRPTKELHRQNIKTRLDNLQKFAIADWEELSKYSPIEYTTFKELYNLINLK